MGERMKEIQALPNERVSMTWEQYQAMRALIKQLGEALVNYWHRDMTLDKLKAATNAYHNYLRERGE